VDGCKSNIISSEYCGVKIPLYRKIEVQFHIFITSALDGSDLSASHSNRLVPRKEKPSTYCVGSCGSPRGDLRILENKFKKNYFE
jgi:hypothetical protein